MPILETTKGNITNGQVFIILSGVLIVAIANGNEAFEQWKLPQLLTTRR
jgi:hypothetical protein